MSQVSPSVWLLAGLLILVMVFAWRQGKKRGLEDSSASTLQPALSGSDTTDSDFHESISALPDALVLLGASWEIEWANVTACNWFGFNLAHHKKRPVGEVVDIDGLTDYLDNGIFSESFDCRAPADNNIHLGIRIARYRENQYLLQGRDITKIRLLEQIRQDFVANASHELRTPLSILYGYLEMMQDEPPNAIGKQWQPAIAQMYEQTGRIKQIIDDMMLLSRLDQVNASADLEYHSFAPLMRQISEDARALSVPKGHDIESQIDENYSLLCDLEDMRSLVTNLVSNAVRYTAEGGRITIKWEVTPACGRLSVRDNGIGIEKENIPRLTERFYRTDPARSRAAGGTGLGLAIVNHIVNRHGARLLIESEIGKGSVFAIEFPATSIRADHDRVNLLLN